MKQYLALLFLFILLIGCTITTPPTTTTSSTTTSSTISTTNPEPTFTPVETVTVSNLTVDVAANMATAKWKNPIKNTYSYSELYLYRLVGTETSSSYEFVDTYYLNKALSQYPLTQLSENTTYYVQIASYTTSGTMDYVTTEFKTGTLTTKSEIFKITYRAGQLYKSDMFKNVDASILEVSRSAALDDTNQLGESVKTGETAKILIEDLPPQYTIDDIKWKVYWIDWQKDETDDAYSGDQYSENPVITFEESTQTLTARRMGMGYIIAYIDDTKYSNVLYFDIREKIEKIQVFSPTYILSLDESNDKLTKTTFKAFYYDKDDNRLFLPFVKEAEWTSSDESVITINPIIPTNDKGEPTAVNSTNWAEIIAAGRPGKATVTLITNGVRFEKEVTVVRTLTPQTNPDPTDPTDPSDDPITPEPEQVLPEPVIINSVTFNQSSVTILAYTNEYTKLQYTIDPADASPDLITFTAYSDTTCDTPASGIEIQGDKIKSTKNGTSYIQASWYANGQRQTSALCTVTSETALGEVTFDNYEILLKPGDTFQLTPHYVPAYATIKTKSYTSDNANITVTNDGLIKASSSCANDETANITVQVNQANPKTIRVKISTPVTNIALNNCGAEGELVIMNTGDTWQLSAVAEPNVADVTWSSKYPNDVTIDSTGKITTLKAGGTAIYASAGQIAKVMKYIIVVDKNEYEIIDATENLTGSLDGYITKANGTLAFSKSKLDIAVKDKSGSWVSPTNKLGLKWKINDTALEITNGRGDTSSLALLVTPVLVKDKANNNEEKVLFGQAIIKATNNTISTGVKFGSWVTLSNSDGSPVTLTTTDAGVQTEINKTNFTLECKKQSSTVYIGTSANTPSMIYSNSTATTFTGTNVGAAFSYYAGKMGPNAVKTACFTLGCSAVETNGSIGVIVY